MQINGLEMASSKLNLKTAASSSGVSILLLFRLISLGFLSLNLLHSTSWLPVDGSQINNPLIYTKLRHDLNYLQLYRNYQLEHPHEEKEIQLSINETIKDEMGLPQATEVVYTYYKNKQVDANKVTRDDLILEALDRTYKTRLLPAYMYNYDNPDDKSRASDAKLIDDDKCKRHLQYLYSKLKSLIDRPNLEPISPELAAFFDSYASEEPGLLFGNYHWTGNWRQCYKRQIFDMSNVSEQGNNLDGITNFRGRYCIASIRSQNWEQKIKIKKDELLKSGNYFKYPVQPQDYERFFRIQLGICLPESCDSRAIDTEVDLIRELVVHKLQEPLRSYKLVDLYCLPDETSELRQFEPNAWLLILLATVWCLAIVLATLYDLMRETPRSQAASSNLDKLVSALSLLRNYHRLTETKSLMPPPPMQQQVAAGQNGSNSSNGGGEKTRQTGSETVKLLPNDLLFLNAFKVISMPCILFGHTGMLSIMLNRFPLDYEALENDYLNHFNISSVFFVDWYFVITGFLASYLAFVTKKVERNTPFQWAYTMFHRYWRLAPMYILLFWFSQSLFQHTASGPVWDYGTSNMTLRGVCRRESWIWPLALVPNFHPIHEECIMPAWYIANDMQFYIITPFILISLSRWPIWSWLATVGCIWASMLARIVRYITDPRAQPLELMRPRYDAYMRNNWDMHATYIYPHYRIPSYLIGLLAGHYTYMVLSGKWRSPLYKHPLSSSSSSSEGNQKSKASDFGDTYRWILRAIVCLWGFQTLIQMMFASKFISDLFPRSMEPQVKYFTALIYGTSHASTSLGLAAICVTLMMGSFKWLKSFLSLPIFTLVSRINYFVFLVQVEIIYWLQQSSERVVDLSVRDAFKNWITLAAIVYPMAALFTLWLELPLANLEREFIGSWMASRARANQAKLSTTVTANPARRTGSETKQLILNNATKELQGGNKKNKKKNIGGKNNTTKSTGY